MAATSSPLLRRRRSSPLLKRRCARRLARGRGSADRAGLWHDAATPPHQGRRCRCQLRGGRRRRLAIGQVTVAVRGAPQMPLKTLHSSDGCSDRPTAPSSPRGLSLAGRAAGSGNPAHEQNRRASAQVLVNNSVQRAHARAFSIPPGDARRFDASNRHQGGWACTRPPPRTSAFASCGHAVPSAQDR